MVWQPETLRRIPTGAEAPIPWAIHEPGSLEHSIATNPDPHNVLLVVGRWDPDEGDFRGFGELDRLNAERYAEALNAVER